MNGPAIDLEDATVEGNVFVIEDPSGHRPEIRGRIGTGSTRVSGRVQIRNATIKAHADAPQDSIYARPATPGTALDAAGLSVGAGVRSPAVAR